MSTPAPPAPAAMAHSGFPWPAASSKVGSSVGKIENVRTALLIAMLAALFIVPFTTLLPVFARDILRVGASGQGLLLTAMGIGALGSAVMIAAFGDRMPRGKIMLGGAAVYGSAPPPSPFRRGFIWRCS